MKRRPTPAVAVARAVTAGVVGVGLAAGCAASGRPPKPRAIAPSSAPAAAVTPPGSATTHGSTTTTLDPGQLPQAMALPAADDALFAARTRDLWAAIVADDPGAATPFFFPRAAYLQLKAVPNAAADFENRLVRFFGLDIHAAHALLGPDPAAAQLVGVTVPTAASVWVLPGGEQNRIPYFRVYGTRLTYTEGGRTRSFGIFSMLSWRGEWYVVHLGPNPRPSPQGMVYQPEG